MDTSKIRELSSKLSKYAPEKIDPSLCLIKMGLVIGRTQQFLDDHPKQKRKILKLLDNEEKS